MADLVNYLIAKRRQAQHPLAAAAVLPLPTTPADAVHSAPMLPAVTAPALIGPAQVGSPMPSPAFSGQMGPGLKGQPGFVPSRQAASDRFGQGAGMAYDYAAAYSPAYLRWLLANVFTGQNAPWNAQPDAWRAFRQMTAGVPGYDFGPAA